MKSIYKRDFSKQYFRPLNSFQYKPGFHSAVANNRQLVLAKNLNRIYHISEGNILRLIMYAEIALGYATDSEIQHYYSDLSEIADFEKDSFTIDKIVFRGFVKSSGYTKSFEITNPYIIDKLYNSMLGFMDPRKVIKEKQTNKKKKRPSVKIIKKVATEIYIELTENENITGSKPLYIIGYIFSLYKIGLKKDEPIMTESEHKAQNEIKKTKAETTESYLQYLSGHIKNYINN